MKSKKGVRIGTVFFLIVVTAFVTAIATYFYVSSLVNDLERNQTMYRKLDIINQVISRNYILSIDAVDGYDNIIDGIASGYIKGLGDSSSYYLNQKNYKSASITQDASHIGIGIVYSYDMATGGIAVDFAKYGSPARLAGIQKGDVIIEINGVNVTEDGYKKAVSRLSGEEGSVVALTVVRAGESDLLTFDVTRNYFAPETVQYRLIENNIGYIFINEFDRTTLTSFNVAFEDLTNKGAKGLIIDVRFNASGNFDSVIEVLDRIMPSGIMVSIREKSSDGLQLYFSDDKNISLPIVVIQNEYTSDVAEVFTAALRDTEKAVVVGTLTKGIGVGQRDIPLSDGTAIHLSTYEYVTPGGERFNGVGVAPNYVITMEQSKAERFETLSTEEDDQLQFALTMLKELMGVQ
jgi:carboxyl-terminal processing protease